MDEEEDVDVAAAAAAVAAAEEEEDEEAENESARIKNRSVRVESVVVASTVSRWMFPRASTMVTRTRVS